MCLRVVIWSTNLRRINYLERNWRCQNALLIKCIIILLHIKSLLNIILKIKDPFWPVFFIIKICCLITQIYIRLLHNKVAAILFTSQYKHNPVTTPFFAVHSLMPLCVQFLCNRSAAYTFVEPFVNVPNNLMLYLFLIPILRFSLNLHVPSFQD